MPVTFDYAYVVDPSSGVLTVTSGDLTGGGSSDVLTDNIANGAGDNPLILGDVFNDQVSWAFTNSPYSGTATYDGLGSTGSSSGIIVHNQLGYFYLTNQSVAAGTGVTFTLQPDVICFMPGTMIRTPDGELPVEALKRGDLVTANDGRAMPVTWLGRQTISRLFAEPTRVLPIRIKAGALADNVPSRDLLISPDHAVLVDGALIQAGALVNGTSIVREKDVPQTFTYYHVELDDHSLILAENTPAETFVDNVDRMNFDNWAEHQALYPEGKSVEELPYPRAKARRQVPVAIRVRLGERAEAIGAAAAVAAA